MALLAIAFVALLARSATASFVWHPLQGAAGAAAPESRFTPALGYFPTRNEVVLFGGRTHSDNQASAETWIYSLNTSTWELVSTSVAPSARFSTSYGTYIKPNGESYLVVAHGTRRGTAVNDEIWVFSAQDRTWTQLPRRGSIPKARYGAVGDIYPGTDLFVLGHGFGTFRFSTYHAYDISAQAWFRFDKGTHPYTPSKPHARCLTAGALVQPDRLFMYGGCMQSGFTGGTCPSRDGWVGTFKVSNSSDPTAIDRLTQPKWKRVKDHPTPRDYPAVARVPAAWGLGNDLAILVGGTETGKQTIRVGRAPENVIEIVDTTRRQWLTATPEPTQPNGPLPGFRSGVGLAVDDAGGRIFMFGGTPRNGSAADDTLWYLDYDAQSLAGGVAALSQELKVTHKPGSFFYYIHLHGLCMGLAWGLLLPGGIMMARHLRHRDPLWFKLHRAMQVTGVTINVLGLIFVVVGGAVNPIHAHGIIGIIVILCSLSQPINAYYRPHKGMKWRTQWEYLHKGTGWTGVTLGLVNISLGVFFVVGPSAAWIAWFAILAVVLLLAASLEALLWIKRRAVSARQSMAGDMPLDKDPVIPKEHELSSHRAHI